MYLAFMRHATIVLHLLPGSDLQYNFKILPEHQLQNLIQTEQYLNFMTKVDLPNLYQTVVGMLLIINFNNSSTSISLKLPSSHTRVTSIKFTKTGVSQ